MKLLVCHECSSIFNLARETRTCQCGKTMGKYTDNLNAIYCGPCTPLGIDNKSLVAGIKHANEGQDITAFVIKPDCPTFERIDNGLEDE